MPVTLSWIQALMRARSTRVVRKASRTLSRNSSAARARNGTTEKVTRASFAFTRNRAAAKPTILITSVTRATMPWENISATLSTSFVARVTRRPTG